MIWSCNSHNSCKVLLQGLTLQDCRSGGGKILLWAGIRDWTGDLVFRRLAFGGTEKFCLSWADAGTRTHDPVFTKDVLYQLSYVGKIFKDLPAGRRALPTELCQQNFFFNFNRFLIFLEDRNKKPRGWLRAFWNLKTFISPFWF